MLNVVASPSEEAERPRKETDNLDYVNYSLFLRVRYVSYKYDYVNFSPGMPVFEAFFQRDPPIGLFGSPPLVSMYPSSPYKNFFF